MTDTAPSAPTAPTATDADKRATRVRWMLLAPALIVLLFAAMMVSGAVIGVVGSSIGALLAINTVVSSLVLAFFAIFTTEVYGQLVADEA